MFKSSKYAPRKSTFLTDIYPSPAGVVRLILGDGPMNTKNISALLDASKASEWTGLSTSTLAKLRLTGLGPAYSKLGRRVFYRIDDLEAWIEEHRHKSSSEYGAKPDLGQPI
ncbi:MAG: helix-turn-helix domain-containing protein [Aestuariivirga sp.]